jgi:serine/threonine-protein kinase
LPGLAPAFYQNPRISPDGQQVAFQITAALIDIWIYNVARGSLTRLTSEGTSMNPVWSPDGKYITYQAIRKGTRNLFRKPADGTGPEERLTTSESWQAPWSWSPDGGTLAFNSFGPNDFTTGPIWLWTAADRKSHPFVQAPLEAYKSKAQFSSDGRWLAYVSNESGRFEVYVQPYRGPAGKWQVSTGGGDPVVWARSSRELFYWHGNKLMAVKVLPGANFAATPPRELFEGNYVIGEPSIDFDVSPGGQRFLMLQPGEPEPPVTQIDVVLNWSEALKRRVPAR